MLTYALDALLQALRRGALFRLDIQFLIILRSASVQFCAPSCAIVNTIMAKKARPGRGPVCSQDYREGEMVSGTILLSRKKQ